MSSGSEADTAPISCLLVGADHLLPAVADDAPIVNREFDADNSVIKPMAASGKTAVIPLRANRSSPRDYDRQLYGARHLFKNFNPELKRFRPIVTRYEKTAREAVAVRQLVASVVWLN